LGLRLYFYFGCNEVLKLFSNLIFEHKCPMFLKKNCKNLNCWEGKIYLFQCQTISKLFFTLSFIITLKHRLLFEYIELLPIPAFKPSFPDILSKHMCKTNIQYTTHVRSGSELKIPGSGWAELATEAPRTNLGTYVIW